MRTTHRSAKLLLLCTLILNILFSSQPAQAFLSPFPTQQADQSTASPQLELVGYLPGTVLQVVANQQVMVALTVGDLVVIDIRQPAQPRIVSRLLLRTLPSGAGYGQTTLALLDTYVFLSCADHCGPTGLFVINIAVPTAPVVVGKLQTAMGLNAIQIHGNLLYGLINNDLAVIDIHDVTAPKLLAVQPLGDQVGYHGQQLAIVEVATTTYIFVPTYAGQLLIVDVTLPTTPQLITIYGVQSQEPCPRDVPMLANGSQLRLYLNDCQGKLQILDVTQPTQPQEIASYSFRQEHKAYTILAMSTSGPHLSVITASTTRPTEWTLHVLDNTSSSLQEVGSFRDIDYPSDLTTVGPLLLLADGLGVQLLDLTAPALIHEVGRQVIVNAGGDIDSDSQYLYVVGNAFDIIDHQNPVAPVNLAHVAVPYAQNAKVNAGFALVTDYEHGLWLFDTQPPQQLTMVSHSNSPLFHPSAVVISGTLGTQQTTAFLSGDGCTPYDCQPSLIAVNLANLQQPVISVIITDTMGISNMMQRGHLLYLTMGVGLVIFDVTKPLQPTAVGETNLSTSVMSMAITDQALYVVLPTELQSYDLTIPTAPRLTHTLSLPRGYASTITVDHDLLYVKDGFNLIVVSLAEPLHPIIIEQHDLPLGHEDTLAATGIIAGNGNLYVLNGGLTTWRRSSELRGRVLDAWDEPQTGAAIYAWPEDSVIATTLTPVTYTGLLGHYGLPATMTGSYTVQAIVEGYSVWPPTHTGVTHDTAAAKNFYLLTQPVSVTVQPGASATLAYVDGRDLQTEGNIAVGTVDQATVVQLTPIMAFDQTERQFTGNAFALALADASSGQPIDTLAQPITLTIHYSDQGRNATLDERSFQLMIEVAGAWQALPAATGADPITRDLANNAITVALTKPGRYAMFGITNQFYLPFIAQE